MTLQVPDPSPVKDRLGSAGIAAYASGSFATGAFSTVPTVLLLYYSTEIAGVAPALAGLAIFIPKAWSILWDPFVGTWSDRTRTPIGRRRPFLIAGGIGVFASFILLFAAPALPPQGAFIWILTSYFLLATVYSLFAVPYVALPAELAGEDRLRSELVSARITISMLGVLAGASMAPYLVAWFGGGRSGYAQMAVVIATVCLAAIIPTVLLLNGRDPLRPKAERQGLWVQLTMAVRDRTLRRLALSYIAQISASAAFSSILPYVATKVAGRPETDIGVALGAMLVPAIVGAPVWGWLGRKYGNSAANLGGIVFYAVIFALTGWAALTGQSWTVLVFLFALAGLGFAGTQVMPFVMMSHLAHSAAGAGNGSVEGAYAGFWTAIEKLGLAIGPMSAGVALSLSSEAGSNAPALFLAVAPPLFLVLSIPPLLAVRRERSL